jgi:CelD/BcsL family acetyltransferase involved in cellulose biosynthesis
MSTSEAEQVEVRVATSLEMLDEHAEAWDRLATASADRLPMLSHAWVSSFLEHRDLGGAPWQCFFAYQDAELVGVLPLIGARTGLRGRLRGPADSHTGSAYPLLAADAAPSALVALVEAASALAPGKRMRWYRVREDSPVMASLPALEPRMRVFDPVSSQGSLVRTTGPQGEFEATLHSNFRRNLRKARNRVGRDLSVAFQFVGGAEAANPELLRRFLKVESSGWKGTTGTAIARSPHLVAFYETLTRRLAQRGWLEWHTMEFDGEPVACHLAVRLGGAVVLPKIGYDETYARYGPGNLLFRELLDRSFEDPTVDEVNCLTDQPWHANWGMPKIGYAEVMVGPRGPVATTAGLVEMWQPLARAYAHRHPRLLHELRSARERLSGAGRH